MIGKRYNLAVFFSNYSKIAKRKFLSFINRNEVLLNVETLTVLLARSKTLETPL